MYLQSIFLILSISILLLLLTEKANLLLLRTISLVSSTLVFILSTLFLILFDKDFYFFQELYNVEFITKENIYNENIYNINKLFGVDSISICFLFLTSLLIFLCIYFVLNEIQFKYYSIALLLIELFLFLIFSTIDLFIFYIFFEAILIPMFLMIGFWGSRERKIRAVYLFFFYTLCGSILFFIAILYIHNISGTTNLETLLAWKFTFTEQIFLWLAFFLSFASKIPLFPFHIWLPEAHVEAPTAGSILLAGILLKLGVYGFLRFSLPLFPEASHYFSPLVFLLSIIGILYASMNAIRQTDLKRIIAYSSIAHMNLVTLGIFTYSNIAIEGAILQSLSHGFVAGGLFLLVGVLYNRYHSRSLYYYGGLVQLMPLYSIYVFIFTLANIALPGTSSFVGEFLLLAGIYKKISYCSILSAIGVVLCGMYSLWLYNKITFGNIKVNYTISFYDINKLEFFIMIPLFLFIFYIGIFPSFFSSYMFYNVNFFNFF